MDTNFVEQAQRLNEQARANEPFNVLLKDLEDAGVRQDGLVEFLKVNQNRALVVKLIGFWLRTDLDVQLAPAMNLAWDLISSMCCLADQIIKLQVATPMPSNPGHSAILDMPIENLGLSWNSLNCLKRAGVKTVRDLVSYTQQELLNLNWFGKESLVKVEGRLLEFGLTLCQPTDSASASTSTPPETETES